MTSSQVLSRQATVVDGAAPSGTPLGVSRTPANIPVRGFMDPATIEARTAFFVRFLDVLHGTDGIRASHQHTAEMLGIREGFHLLDVGCGTGSFARDVAPHVGATGRVVGVDLSPALIDVARVRTASSAAPIEFAVADALQLPFADETFDGCRVERVLQYLDDPRRALAEMMRVVKPGGRIVAAEVDWDTIVSDLPGIDRDLYRRTTRAKSDSAGNGWMGREIRRHVLDMGLDDVASAGFVVIFTDAGAVLDDLGLRLGTERVRDTGAISPAECGRLIAAEEAAGRAGRYFAAFTLFTVSGRKPRAN